MESVDIEKIQRRTRFGFRKHVREKVVLTQPFKEKENVNSNSSTEFDRPRKKRSSRQNSPERKYFTRSTSRNKENGSASALSPSKQREAQQALASHTTPPSTPRPAKRVSTNNKSRRKTKNKLRMSLGQGLRKERMSNVLNMDGHVRCNTPKPGRDSLTTNLILADNQCVEPAWDRDLEDELTTCISELAVQKYDEAFEAFLQEVLALKGKARRTDYKKKAEEYLIVIKKLRSCLKDLDRRRAEFVDMAASVEFDAVERAARVIEKCKTLKQGKLRLETSLEEIRVERAEEKKAREFMEAELLASKAAEEAAANQARAAAEETAQVKLQAEQLSSELGQATFKAEQLEGELAEALESMEELRKEHNEELTLLENELSQKHKTEVTELNARLEEYRDKAEKQVEALHVVLQGKEELQEERNNLHNENLCLLSEKRQAEALATHQELQIQSYKEDLKLSRQLLEDKTRELQLMMENFNQSQRSSQSREEELRIGRKSAEEKASKLEASNMQLMEEMTKIKMDNTAMVAELNTTKETLATCKATAETESEAAKKALEEVRQARQDLAIEKELRACAEAREVEERRERTAACSQLMATETGHRMEMERISDETIERNAAWEKQDCERKEEITQLEAQLAESKEAEAGLSAECASLRKAVEEFSQKTVVSAERVEEMARTSNELERMRRRNEELTQIRAQDITGHTAKVAELEEKVKQLEANRRKMHNLVQELRGNVRVLVRVRPFLPDDGQEKDLAKPNNQWGVAKFHPDGTQLSIEQEVTRMGQMGEKTVCEPVPFKFDKVFAPSVGQERVFGEVQDLVQSALDGFNVCIFCYGQTGSGKTHTIQGAKGGPMKGIIPRAIQQLGEAKCKLEEDGWFYRMEASFLEIYNEQIRDLMVNTASGDSTTHDIKMNKEGQLYVTNLQLIPVDPNNTELIEDLMETANRHRTTARTDMNARSSRSHSVFTLHLHASNDSLEAEFDGKLHLVDLAGSERLSRSNATGQRLKEAQAINSSLSCLSDVFSAISHHNSHIPFRNSKLTYLLQPALSGDGKTLMIVNVSPTNESYHESLCSLRFASSVNKCELGRPRKQVRQRPTTRRKTQDSK